MRKILVLQHVAHEILGTLNPLLKDRGFRIKYVNFGREPESTPAMDKYNGLIILGGPMGVYEVHRHKHLLHEMHVIEQALKKDVPILGICLGSQLLSHVLGGRVFQGQEPEIGWCPISLTEEGSKDPLFRGFNAQEEIFQVHQDTFDLPHSVTHLAQSAMYPAQAFRHGDKVYGFQYHLEVDEAMILRWLKISDNIKMFEKVRHRISLEQIQKDTHAKIARSLELSRSCFSAFADLFGEFERVEVVGSGHKGRR